ncbi:MAG: T9SS type A sorting domain-containing protein [Bacteroidia bacterium]
MKKHLTLIALLLISNTLPTMSQIGTQRLVLAEDFSSIFCTPSTPANIYFNSLINVNASKVVKLTYQWNMGGNDPMYLQNSGQLTVRDNYYYVPYVPYSLMNGSIATLLGPNYAGAPYNWTQTKIDSAWAIPAPFSILLTHSLNQALDSIFITAMITCEQNITMTTPKFRCAMTEEHIHFASPPGSNGETDFFDIMRKMYPDANGTPIAASWATGQTQTIIFAEKIPLYIYDKNQIAVVVFIQDDFTKNVEQAFYSAPLSSVGINEVMKENNLSVFPNPSSGSTTISFSLSKSEKTSVKIFDINGRLITTLAKREFGEGKHNIKWDAEDVGAGIYFLRVDADTYSENQKLIVAK